MTTLDLDSVKRPALLLIVSLAILATLILLWLRFPRFVPLGVVVVLGLAAAGTFIVAETQILLRIVRSTPSSRHPELVVHKVSLPTALALAAMLALWNVGFIYFSKKPLDLQFLGIGNIGVVFAWWSSVSVLARLHKDGARR